MSIDKFGRYSDGSGAKNTMGPRGVGFSLTSSGDYDIKGKHMCNVADPAEDSDAANKTYVDSKVPASYTDYWDFNHKRLSSIGDAKYDGEAVNYRTLKHTTIVAHKGSWNATDYRIINVKEGKDPKDAVNLETLNTRISEVTKACGSNIAGITKTVADVKHDLSDFKKGMKRDMFEMKGVILDIENNHKADMKEFGQLLFKYIQSRQLDQPVALPDDKDWRELFKTQ